MAWLSLLAYYALLWWLCLFAVLSFGLRTQEEAGEVVPGTEPSAPAKPAVLRIIIRNTIVSAIVFAVLYYLIEVLGFGLDSFPSIYPQDQ